MAMYSLGVLTTNVTTAAACAELRTSSTDRVQVREIGITLNAATLTTIGLGRPAAIGVTPTSPVTLLQQDPADAAATSTHALAWGTGPTVPTNFLRRAAFPATIGAGIIWTFGPRELIIAVSASLVLWNILGGAALNAYWVVEE